METITLIVSLAALALSVAALFKAIKNSRR